ncbi:kinase-like domain-containing protein [Lobosporangium transversale]|uniref:Kinase-like domain-containing protein n=1 Tax=Lobosporangium transversale TaxID=64571 RepID=A0A1Y2GWR1_9FUNG|nr:kinase-like domain-containing protein [Lobosporangium transversale]ORZ26254.1 kinase-like domain-containing protein [Lobosporangium transversale]|eukprot:XP_021884019.1 kinase-like domain-containing protein [Lobosporangium transversale]
MASETEQPLCINTKQEEQGKAAHDNALLQENDDSRGSFEVESAWQEQPVHLPAYTPSTAAKHATRDSPPTTPVDDPIHFMGSRKHFGFSARQSIASSIFPWQKNKPAVYHQYAPHRPPLSKRSSLAGLKVLPLSHPDPVKHMDDVELDIIKLKGDHLRKRVLELLHLMEIQDWAEVTDYQDIHLDRISGAMTNCIFLVTGPPSSHSTLDNIVPKPRKVLLRVYGVGLESLFSRSNELQWLRNLSMMDIGPSLLGIFRNGRFEQYVESTTLTKEDIRDPRTSRHIAHRMCELHNIVNIFPPPEGTIPQSQDNIARWIPLARDAIEKICEKDPSKRAIMDEFNFDKLLVEIAEVQKALMRVHSPLVFAHNDAQYGNILRTLDESGELVVIDFEYAGYNTRGFDIGNHFCEWTADYHSERPSLMHPERYPTKAEQLNFLEAYMEAEIAMCGYHLTAIDLSKYSRKRRSITATITKGLANVALTAVNAAQAFRKGSVAESRQEEVANADGIANGNSNGSSSRNSNDNSNANTNGHAYTDHSNTTTTTAAAAAKAVGKGNSALENSPLAVRRARKAGDGGGVTKAEILDSMYKEVNKFALTSHIMWGLWGLIQATQSEIEFDYFEYALQRLTEFRRCRDEYMSL